MRSARLLVLACAVTVFTGARLSAAQADDRCLTGASRGVQVTGQVLPTFRPLKNHGWRPDDASLQKEQLSTWFIPDAKQGVATASYAQCNCLCAGVQTCVGYTWLGDSGQCWLHSYILLWVYPAFNYTDASGALQTVHPDTVTARVQRGSAQNQLCAYGFPDNSTGVTRGVKLTAYSAANISNFNDPAWNTPQKCMRACLNEPACVAMIITGPNSFAGSNLYNCTLASQAWGPVVASDVPSMQVMTVQVCGNDIQAAIQAPPLPASPPPPPGPALQAIRDCRDKAQYGIQFKGQVHPDFKPVKNYGWRPDDTTLRSLTISNWFIPDSKQGTVTASYQDCNCLCAEVPTCIGYTWLAGGGQCWLHSFISFWEYPAFNYTDASGALRSVDPASISGRVEKDPALYRMCGLAYPELPTDNNPGTKLTAFSAAGIANFNDPSWTNLEECMLACMREPTCVAMVIDGANDRNSSTRFNCTLASQGWGPIVPSNTSSFVIGVQACGDDIQAAISTPPAPSVPNPAPLAPAPALPTPTPPDGGSDSKSLSPGVIAGIAAGTVALIGLLVGLTVWYVRHDKQASQKKQAARKTTGKGKSLDYNPSEVQPGYVVGSKQKYAAQYAAQGHSVIHVASEGQQGSVQHMSPPGTAGFSTGTGTGTYTSTRPSQGSGTPPPVSAQDYRHSMGDAGPEGVIMVANPSTHSSRDAQQVQSQRSPASWLPPAEGSAAFRTPFACQPSSQSQLTGRQSSQAPSQIASRASTPALMGGPSGVRIPLADVSIGAAIGEGNLGTVYKGWWQSNRVAVKTLKFGIASRDTLEVLAQQAACMKELGHPCIARVYGMVDEPPNHALVMQLYKRGSLAALMKRTTVYATISKEARISMAVDVASGMSFLHQREPPVLHQDLKCSNLLLEQGNRVMISDVGIAAVLRAGAGQKEGLVPTSSSSSSSHTLEGIASTPPELLLDPYAPRTPAADVYAFGIVLLEIMTGQPAFAGRHWAEVRTMLCSGMRPAVPGSVEPAIAALISDCWAQDPSMRPPFSVILKRLLTVLQELNPDHFATTTCTTTMYQ